MVNVLVKKRRLIQFLTFIVSFIFMFSFPFYFRILNKLGNKEFINSPQLL